MLCSTHTVQSTFPAKLLPDPGQLRTSVSQAVHLSVCLSVQLSDNWQMELQRLCNWVWKCLPRLNSEAAHSTGPSDQTNQLQSELAPSTPHTHTHTQLFVRPLNAQLPFTIEQNSNKNLTSSNPFGPFPILPRPCFYSTRIKLQNVLASKNK